MSRRWVVPTRGSHDGTPAISVLRQGKECMKQKLEWLLAAAIVWLIGCDETESANL
jgi:hypothetical protein